MWNLENPNNGLDKDKLKDSPLKADGRSETLRGEEDGEEETNQEHRKRTSYSDKEEWALWWWEN